jgi:hypothetical protein
MRVMYPGPKAAVVIDEVEIKRGEEGELTAEQFKRAEELGVMRAADAPAQMQEPKKSGQGGE